MGLNSIQVYVFLTLAYSLPILGKAQTCTQTPFPIFIGGYSTNTTQTTELYAIDYHANTNQVVTGGRSLDPGILNKMTDPDFPFPLLVMYSGASFSYAWGVFVEVTSFDYVNSISISYDG